MAETEHLQGLLERWQAGVAEGLAELLPLVYGDLRNLAASELRGHRGHDTLQPTALVNEMFVRLLGAGHVNFSDRRHLFNGAARIMRQILVDDARRSQAGKRGGGWIREDFHASLELPIPEHYGLEEVDEALQALEVLDAELAAVVELRFFGGLEMAEIGQVIGRDERTVHRRWTVARAWLRDRLGA